MADVRPFRALHYDLARVGALEEIVSPPYDVIDEEDRSALLAHNRHNVVEIDRPRSHDDPYAHAAQVLAAWVKEGVLVRDEQPAIWALEQDYTTPDGQTARRHGILARVRLEEYGAGRIRPHERTHPGPREDRLRLTRATRTNVSPIFTLYDDPPGAAWKSVADHIAGAPWGQAEDLDGTNHRLWRVTDAKAIKGVQEALSQSELLIADGHHRYETAMAYAAELGGQGGHRYVFMCLVAVQDPGLAIFPTHRLIHGIDAAVLNTLYDRLAADWEIAEISVDDLVPTANGKLCIGLLDRRDNGARMLTLRDRSRLDALMPDKSRAYRQLDTAALEALVLKGVLGMSHEDIAHFNGLEYARSAVDARGRLAAGQADLAFFTSPLAVRAVQQIAAAGETMPPKSTYFFPKILTGMLFSPLDEP